MSPVQIIGLYEISRLRYASLEMTKEGEILNDKGPRQWRGPIGLLCPLPELPGPDGLKFGIDFPVIHHVVQGEEAVIPLEVAAFIHPLDKRALAGKEDAPSVHGEKTVKKRKSREIAPRSLQPQIVRAPGTHQSGPCWDK